MGWNFLAETTGSGCGAAKRQGRQRQQFLIGVLSALKSLPLKTKTFQGFLKHPWGNTRQGLPHLPLTSGQRESSQRKEVYARAGM